MCLKALINKYKVLIKQLQFIIKMLDLFMERENDSRRTINSN